MALASSFGRFTVALGVLFAAGCAAGVAPPETPWNAVAALAGVIRLDKESKHIYMADATVSSDGEVIDIRTYPAGIGADYYAGSYGEVIGGFTTIPNTLPN
jgi:hypothetical protein